MDVDLFLVMLAVAVPVLWLLQAIYHRWGGANLLVPAMMVQSYWFDVGFSLKPYLVLGSLLLAGLLMQPKNGLRLQHVVDVFRPIFLPFTLMVILMLFATLIGDSGMRAIRHILLLGWGWIIVGSFVAYCPNKEFAYRVHSVQASTLLLMGLAGCLGYGFYIGGVEWVASSRQGMGLIYQEINDMYGRLRLYCLDPNHLATFLVPLLLTTVGYHFYQKEIKTNRKISALAILTGLTTLVLTFSRGGLIGASIGSLFFILLAPGKARKIRNICLAVVVATLLLLLVAPDSFIKGVESRYTFRSSFGAEDTGRIALWLKAVDVIQSNTWFGVGQGQLPEYTNHQAHNTFLELFAENGVFTFACFLIILIIVLIKGVKVSKQLFARGSPEAYLMLGAVSGLVGMSTMLMSISLFTEIFFWFQLCMVLLFAKIYQPTTLPTINALPLLANNGTRNE